MALNFPDSPSVNDKYTVGSTTWIWDGTVWNSTTASIIPTYVSSFNGSTGDVEGVSSINGMTGAIYSGRGRPWLKPTSGNYWTPLEMGDSTTTLALTNLRIIYYPWVAPANATIDGLGLQVTTAGTSAQARVGIYNSDSNGYPTGDPFVTTVDLDCTTTGSKIDTTVSFSVTRGVQYWIATHATWSGTQTIISGVARGSAFVLYSNNPAATTALIALYQNSVAFASGLPTSLDGTTLFGYNTTFPTTFLRLA